MIIVAKIIAVLISLKGLFFLLFPGRAGKLVLKFKEMKKINLRTLGVVCLLTGCILFYLTRVYLERLLVHWVVAVCGIWMIIAGLTLIIFPESMIKFALWFHREKGTTSFIGLILLVGGLVLYAFLK